MTGGGRQIHKERMYDLTYKWNMTREYIRTEERNDADDFQVTEKYLLDGKLHREDEPAEIWSCATKRWEDYYLNGRRHRESGPASVMIDLRTGVVYREDFLRNGQWRPCSDGPAIIFRDHCSGEITRRLYLAAGKFTENPLLPCAARARRDRSSCNVN